MIRPLQPRSLEIGYYREIKKTVDAWSQAVIANAHLLPAGNERTDGYFEDTFAFFLRAVRRTADQSINEIDFAKWFSDVSLFQWRNWMGEVKRKTRYELPATTPWHEEGIDRLGTQWINNNVRLIKGFSEQRDAKLKDAVFNAVTRGRSRKQLIDEILPSVRILNENGGATNLTAEQRADLIATDQILTANSQLNAQRMVNAKVAYYIWRGMDDARERPAHVRLNDMIFRVDGQPMTAADLKIVGRSGQAILTPGNETAPGIPVRCRCYAEAIFAGSIYDFGDENEGASAPASLPDFYTADNPAGRRLPE